MIDIEKQVAYWRKGAAEDWSAAQQLVKTRKTRHGLFFARLALEKLLKAHVCRQTKDLAPPIHNLIRLGQLSGLVLNQKQMDVLAEMNAFNIEGRYPESLAQAPSVTEAKAYLSRTKGVMQWLTKQF